MGAQGIRITVAGVLPPVCQCQRISQVEITSRLRVLGQFSRCYITVTRVLRGLCIEWRMLFSVLLQSVVLQSVTYERLSSSRRLVGTYKRESWVILLLILETYKYSLRACIHIQLATKNSERRQSHLKDTGTRAVERFDSSSVALQHNHHILVPLNNICKYHKRSKDRGICSN